MLTDGHILLLVVGYTWGMMITSELPSRRASASVPTPTHNELSCHQPHPIELHRVPPLDASRRAGDVRTSSVTTGDLIESRPRYLPPPDECATGEMAEDEGTL